MAESGEFEVSVASHEAGMRLDAFAASHLPDCSRSYAALLIRQGQVTVDNYSRKPAYKLKVHERVRAVLPEPKPVDLVAEPMDLDLLFEDDWLIVINKPAGLVVHPAAGHPSGTLVNGLLHHCSLLEGIGGQRRPGIVHRLDKDTSGVIVVAKTAVAHHEVARQFKARSVRKQYLALVHGVPRQESGVVNLPVGRHPKDRKRMSTVSRSGRNALTMWRIKATYGHAALLEVDLKTGRTHQIRVHCQSMGHPLVGEKVYGGTKALARLARTNTDLHQILVRVRRQMLHAALLEFTHPVNGRLLSFSAQLPGDMKKLLHELQSNS